MIERTWVLPEEAADLRRVMTEDGRKKNVAKTYIAKPEDGSQGDGIFMVQTVRDLETTSSSHRCSLSPSLLPLSFFFSHPSDLVLTPSR